MVTRRIGGLALLLLVIGLVLVPIDTAVAQPEPGDASFSALPGFAPIAEFALGGSGLLTLDQDRAWLWTVEQLPTTVVAFDAAGNEQRRWQALDADRDTLEQPSGLMIYRGSVWITTYTDSTVHRYDLDGGHLDSFETGSLSCGAVGVGNRIYVASFLDQEVSEYTLSGGFVNSFGGSGQGDGELDLSCSMKMSHFGGELFVPDSNNGRVAVFGLNGKWRRNIGDASLDRPVSVDIDSNGLVYVSDEINKHVSVWTGSGAFVGSQGGPGIGLGQFSGIGDVVVDPSADTFWVTDRRMVSDRVQAFSRLTCDGGQTPTVVGTSFSDQLTLTDGADIAHLAGGDDTVNARAGDDVVCAGLGNDVVSGGLGDDRVFAQGGNDILRGNAGADIMFGQGGDDHISGGAGNDVLRGGAHADTVLADGGNDIVFGNTGDDVIRGGVGNDIIRGQANVDELFGDAGNDRIIGGGGRDTHNGGAGTDICLEGASQGLPETYISCETQPA